MSEIERIGNIDYRPATQADLDALAARGVPVNPDADVLVPVNPEQVARMREEMLTQFAPATGGGVIRARPARRTPVSEDSL